MTEPASLVTDKAVTAAHLGEIAYHKKARRILSDTTPGDVIRAMLEAAAPHITAEAAAKLARVAACTREWKLLVGDGPEALADAILAIISSEEET